MKWSEAGQPTFNFYEVAAFGGKGGGSPPPAPDPMATANAQTASNIQTANANADLNRVSQYGPYGQVVYSPAGTTYENGQPITQWAQTTTLSPAEQGLFDTTTEGQQIYGNAAVNELGQASSSLSTPFSANIMQPETNFNNVRDQSLQAGLSMLQPQLNMQQEDLNSQLLNEGVTQGSEAWNNAQRQFGQQENNAYEQNILNAENLTGQAVNQQGSLVNQQGATIQQQMGVRDLPLNEAASMLTGQQVQSPQFSQVPQTNVAPTDVIGATMGAYNAQMQGYQGQVAQNSANMGGLYGLGGAAIVGGAIVI